MRNPARSRSPTAVSRGTSRPADFEKPSFWLPPFVGPWFLKRTLQHGAPQAIDKIEELAQEVGGLAARVDSH